MPPPADVDASLAYNINDIRNYSLAVSGEVFRWIVDFASPLVLQRVSRLPQTRLWYILLTVIDACPWSSIRADVTR